MNGRHPAQIALPHRLAGVGALVALVAGATACGSEDPHPDEGGEDPAGALADLGGQPGTNTGSGAPEPAPVVGPGGAGGGPSIGSGGATTADAGGMAGAAGDAGSDSTEVGGSGGEEDPVCELPDPDEFLPDTNVGGGGAQYAESDHFRIYGSSTGMDAALNHLEAAHRCFVEDWCFRSPGLSVHSDDGPYYKFNVYIVQSLGGAAGVMQYDARAGISYLEVITRSIANPRVTVHELGHSITLSEYGWVDQTRTGAWWETVAEWFADTYLTSPFCAAARDAFGVPTGRTLIDLDRVISQSWRTMIDTQNYYQAWPFLTYLTHNPDGYPGLGRMAVPDLFRNHARNNETPLHVLERIAAPVSVQTILGRYWARMAYLDIEHPQAREAFFSRRGSLNFDNLDSAGEQTYRVKAARQPRYGGSNIIPLTVTGGGEVSVAITNLGNGLSDSNFTATIAVRSGDGSVRYVDLPGGSGQATLAGGEEASLVVVNTPDALYQYDAFRSGPSSPESIGLDYEVRLSGAVPSH